MDSYLLETWKFVSSWIILRGCQAAWHIYDHHYKKWYGAFWTKCERLLRQICTLSCEEQVNHVECTINIGFISGTNNARLAAMLRQLAVYHQKDPNNLFMVRLAQGLTHLGKGTLTLCPYHSDKALMSPVAVAGLMAVVTACLDVKTCKSLTLMKTLFSESLSYLEVFLLNKCVWWHGLRKGLKSNWGALFINVKYTFHSKYCIV